MTTLNRPEHMDEVVFDKFLLWNIDDTEKERILKQCVHAQEDSVFGQAFDEACKEFKLSGDDYPLANDVNAGHVKSRERAIDVLQEALFWERERIEDTLRKLAQTDKGVAQIALEELFDSLQDYDEETDDQIDAKYFFHDPWLYFLTEKPATPYDIKTRCLPARLALPSFDSGVKEFIGFEINSTKVNKPSGPTIADAGYHFAKKYWVPGGKTNPLDHCDDCATHSGLDEIVCDQILLSEIEMTLEIIEV